MKTINLMLFSFCFAIKSLAQSNDRWYILSLGDKPVGYYHEVYSKAYVNSKYVINSESTFKMSLSRLGTEVDMSSTAAQKESVSGKLESMVSESLLSKQRTIIKAAISSPYIFLTTTTGDKDVSRKIVFKGSLTGNEKLRLLTIQNLKKVGDSINYQTYFPDFNMVVHGHRKLDAIENIKIVGKRVHSLKITDGFEELPISRKLWLDQSGRLLKSSEPNPYGQMTIELSDKMTSLGAASQPVNISKDQYTNTIARSNIRLPQARQMQSVTLKLTLKNPEQGFPNFSGAYQQVLEKGINYVVLKVTSPMDQGKITVVPSEINKKEFLESNSFLNKDDTLVISTARQIVGKATNPWKKAQLIRDWVHTHMKFNPGIVMAASNEVIRNMEGTCISFATITTTLCRAAEIPSRFLMGYVYTDGMWGGHAWTEININDKWYPIDAALTGPNIIADAARFYFVRSSMNNGPGETFLGGQQLYSNVEIRVLSYMVNNEVENAGMWIYYVTDSSYINPGLKLTMKKLEGFDFSDEDRIYPESILFSQINKNTEDSVMVYQYYLEPTKEPVELVKNCLRELKITAEPVEMDYSGSLAFLAADDNQIGMAIINGSEIYLIAAKGKKPKGLLEKSLRSLDFKKFSHVNFD